MTHQTQNVQASACCYCCVRYRGPLFQLLRLQPRGAQTLRKSKHEVSEEVISGGKAVALVPFAACLAVDDVSNS